MVVDKKDTGKIIPKKISPKARKKISRSSERLIRAGKAAKKISRRPNGSSGRAKPQRKS